MTAAFSSSIKPRDSARLPASRWDRPFRPSVRPLGARAVRVWWQPRRRLRARVAWPCVVARSAWGRPLARRRREEAAQGRRPAAAKLNPLGKCGRGAGAATLCRLDSTAPSSVLGLLTRLPAFWPLLSQPCFLPATSPSPGRRGIRGLLPCQVFAPPRNPSAPFLTPFPAAPSELRRRSSGSPNPAASFHRRPPSLLSRPAIV